MNHGHTERYASEAKRATGNNAIFDIVLAIGRCGASPLYRDVG
jgi:hypothetical protein